MPGFSELRRALRKASSPARARSSARFFKTGLGQYGQGDVFIGVAVPEIRKLSRRLRNLSLSEIKKLLSSKIHEERLCALMLLVRAYAEADEAGKKKIYSFYIRRFESINNWDLVDGSAEFIVGDWLLSKKDRSVLIRWAKSKHLWTRRIAILSTFAFIKAGEYKDAFRIAEMLLNDKEDLMHKAVGWMLREVGKRVSEEKLRSFLKKNAAWMPRTALRYAIEKFSEAERKRWLKA
jgi:3-methyladenine DNA glycosylase AlkD